MSDEIVREGPGGSVDLDVQVVPRASRDAIGARHGDRLKIHVKAPPVDGEANDALVRLVADRLGTARSHVSVVRGATGKRKTLRILGATTQAVRQALGLTIAFGLFAGAPACQGDARELPITVLLPEDSTDLESVDNASLTLDPGGLLLTEEIDGLDFSLAIALEPDPTVRTLSLFLAEGTSLRAWGTSAPFITAGPDVDLALFVGRPGRLSTFPRLIENPDADLLAANAVERGVLLLDTQGHTFLLNHTTLEVEVGATLEDAPPPTDGGLFSSPDGSVHRVAWEGALIAHRYDPGADTWTELAPDPDALGDRSGAAHLVEVQTVTDGDETELDATFLHLFGGGAQLDAVSVVLLPDGVDVRALEDVALDGPRVGAHAAWVAEGEDSTVDVLLFGGNDGDLPALRLALDGSASGPTDAWSGGRCVQLSASEPVRMLCAGGRRLDLDTADALDVDLTGSVTTTERLEFLPLAMRDPMWLADESAVYAQGAESLVKVARDDLQVEAVAGTSLRSAGGHFVTLSTGATFLTGGVSDSGDPLTRWQVFMPAIDP